MVQICNVALSACGQARCRCPCADGSSASSAQLGAHQPHLPRPQPRQLLSHLGGPAAVLLGLLLLQQRGLQRDQQGAWLLVMTNTCSLTPAG